MCLSIDSTRFKPWYYLLQTPTLIEQIWCEVQWRPLGSTADDSSDIATRKAQSIRKPMSAVKKLKEMDIVPFVLLHDLLPKTFYEITMRYVKYKGDILDNIEPISAWSGIVHAETLAVNASPLINTKETSLERLGKLVSALFYPRIFEQSTVSTMFGGEDGLFGPSSELLYTVLGIIVGCLVITLFVFIILCALRQKRQKKYIRNMRRQLNRLPSKDNLNRLLTPSQMSHQNGYKRPHFAAASPQGTSLSHSQQTHREDLTPGSASQHFQHQINLFTGSALSSPTAISAAVAAADASDSILISGHHNERPKLSAMNHGNAYGTMSRLSSKRSGSQIQSPLASHNPYYRTLDSHRMFANGSTKYNILNNSKNGTPIHGPMSEQHQPLLTAESAFVEPPYELPSAVIAQQQRLMVTANQHAVSNLGGSPLAGIATSSPASGVAQHYSTYSTFGRKNPLTSVALPARLNGTNVFNNSEPQNTTHEGVAMSEMGIATNGIFLSNSGADSASNRSGPIPTSVQSSSASPSGNTGLPASSANQAFFRTDAASSVAGPQSTVSGSDQNGKLF